MKALIINSYIKGTSNSPISEIKNLVTTLGYEIDFVLEQKLNQIHRSTYIGQGFKESIKEYIQDNDIDVIVFNHDLSPLQVRNLYEAFDKEILDRSMVIIKIFEMRANSKEAQLQVGLAKLKYLSSRLRKTEENYDQISSGAGFNSKGSGEKEINLTRSRIKEEIAKYEKDLAEFVLKRSKQREKRKSKNIRVAAIVGYTNAGKSTLFNSIVRESKTIKKDQILQENRLFATLNTTTRAIKYKNYPEFLITDTVGFISDLPTSLIMAFRSTLEEIKEADMLIMVVDASNPNMFDEVEVTEKTLLEIGVDSEIPTLYLFNKADKVSSMIEIDENDHVLITSLIDNEDVDRVLQKTVNMIFSDYVELELSIPYTSVKDYYELKENAIILKEKNFDDYIKVVVKVSRSDLSKFAKYL